MRSEGTASTLALDRADALLMVIDVQEKLAAAMPKAPLAELERNAAVLIRAARRLEIPVIATEQYPKGLGPTVPELAELMIEQLLAAVHFCGHGATAGCGLDDGLLHFFLQGFILRFGFGHQVLQVETTHGLLPFVDRVLGIGSWVFGSS